MKKLFSFILMLGLSIGLMAQDNLYLIGDACSANWDAANALPMTKSGDTFSWTGQLNPGELKFLTAPGSWDNAYGSNEYDKCVWTGGDYTFAALTDGDRKFQIKLRGTYTITINGGTINFAWTDRIYPVGDGCSVGWNVGDDKPYLEAVNSCVYMGKVTFSGSGEFKLLKQPDWGEQFGPATSGVAINAVGGYDITTPTDDYKYNIGLSGEYDVVLDVYAGKLYVGTILPSVTIKAQFASNVATAYDNSFNLYYWTAMGAGNVTMMENDGWYEATMENVFAPYNFLFNKAADNWELKTPNLENNLASALCVHVTNTGVLTATIVEDCSALEGEDEPMVRPEVKLLGLNSWVLDEGYTMEEADDQMSCSYTATLTAGTHQFKIYTTNDYAYNGADYQMKRDFCTNVQLYSSGSEPNVKIQADMAGEYTFIYYYDTRKLSVVYPELPTAEGKPQVSLKGIGGDWGGIVMTPADDEQTCSCTVTITAEMILTGWQNFKVFFQDEDDAEHWLGGEVTLTRNAANGMLEDEASARNAYLLADFAGDYVFTYTYDTKAVSVTYPTLPEVDLKGINGDWAGVHMAVAANQQSATYTYSLAAGSYEFKIYFMEQGEQQWLGCGTALDPAVMTRGNSENFLFVNGAQNCQLTADYSGDYIFTYDFVSHKVSVAYPAVPEPQSQTVHMNGDGFATVYMEYDFTLPAGLQAYRGTLSEDAIVLSEVNETILPGETGLVLYSSSKKDVDITLTESFEVAAPIDENDFIGTLAATIESNVYVLAHTSEANSTAFYHVAESVLIPAHRAYLKLSSGPAAAICIRFATEVATNLESGEQTHKTMKVVRNGRVVIVRDGREYTVLGEIVK